MAASNSAARPSDDIFPAGHGTTRARNRELRLSAALAIGTLLLLQYPVVQLVEAAQSLSGRPYLLFYVFGVWALSIAGAALILERRAR